VLPDLVGRAALVTGAGRGIGRAIAVDLADALFEIESNDAAAAAFVRDLADLDAAGSLLPDVERELGPIEILINNAGQWPPSDPRSHWNRPRSNTHYDSTS
jgi:NAD(P)-dependent dehydrogenase (short-subunit alcohol dehydrogenase family)